MGQKIVRALPTELGAEDAAVRLQSIVQRRSAQWPNAHELLARPAHRVVQPQRLRGAIEQVFSIGLEWSEPANVDVPEIERRCTLNDPFRDQSSSTSGVCDARRIESGADVIAFHFGCFTEDEIPIEREALGSVQQHLDFGGLETGRAVNRVL